MAITISGNGITSANIADGTITNADINASAAIDASKLTGTGKVLQVVGSQYSGEKSQTTTTLADTGLTLSITPSSTSSKIAVFVNQAGVRKWGGNGGCYIELQRNGTLLQKMANRSGHNDSTSGNGVGTDSIAYLDSPNTTSAVTYKTQYKSQVSGVAVRVQDDSSVSTILLMEIEG